MLGAYGTIQRARKLSSGLWVGNDRFVMVIDQGVGVQLGSAPTEDPYVLVKIVSNKFDDVRTCLVVNEFVLNPYLDFAVGSGAVQTAMSLAGALRGRGFRADQSGVEIQVRMPAPEEPLTVQAPYNWGSACITVYPEFVMASPGVPFSEVIRR